MLAPEKSDSASTISSPPIPLGGWQGWLSAKHLAGRRSQGVLMLVLYVFGILPYLRGTNSFFAAEDFEVTSLAYQSFSQMWETTIIGRIRIRPIYFSFGWTLSSIFGSNPIGYHLVLIAIQGFTTLLVYWLGCLLSRSRLTGVVAALVFAVYPRHHEPVVWLSANHLLLVVPLMLICACAFIQYLQTQRKIWDLLALFSLAIALFTHEVSATLFVLLPLIELLLYREQRAPKVLLSRTFYAKYFPYVAIATLYLLLSFGGSRISKLSASAMLNTNLHGETYHFTGIGLGTLKDITAYYVYLLFPFIPLRSLDPGLIATGLALAALGLLAAFLAKGTALIRFSVVWMMLTVLPFALFVPFGNADRYFYPPAVGFAILCAVLLVRFARAWKHGKLVATSILALYLIASITILQQRINEWQHAGEMVSDITTQVVRLHPDLAPDDKILFVGLPGYYGQAFVFLGGGIPGALGMAYNRQSIYLAYETSDPDVRALLDQARPIEHPQTSMYVFLYKDGVIVDKSRSIADLSLLKPATWMYRSSYLPEN